MGSKFLFTILFLCILSSAGILFALFGKPVLWLCALGAVELFLMILLFRSVIMPSSTAVRGMELIAAQDFNNRLTHVGEYNADKIVTLFNSLIDKLRNERLHNLEQDSFLRRLVEVSPMGVMILDFNGKISLVNASMAKMIGIHNEKELLGKTPESLASDIARSMLNVPLGVKMILRRGDFRMYRCYHLSFVQTGFQRHFYLLESLTEEVKKAEREAYEKVIRIISHEVNNTMGGVKSVLELLHDSCEDDDVKEVIESCDHRCDSMCSFISSYAEVVKVPEPVKSNVNLNEEIENLVPFFKEMAHDGITVEFNRNNDSLWVSIDIALMQQVIVNIVKNAIESISCKGMIRINTGVNSGHPWLEISNNGEPISEEVSYKLFSPFFTTKKEGRGLGLTLIAEILNRHKANFSLRTGEDGITRFHIEF